MSERAKPPFRADQVGSLVRPTALVAARQAFDCGELSREHLRELEDAEVRKVVKLQEDVGLPVVTDGEFRRESWNRDFLLKFANVVLGPSRIALGYTTAQGEAAAREPTALKVTGKIARPQPIFVEHFKFLKSITRMTPKLTIPSPTILHFRGGREAIDAVAYPDIEAFYADVARVYQQEIADLAAAGCRYLQIDDVNFAYLCDARVFDQVRALGEDPDALLHRYAKLINDALAKHPPEMTVALHMCRGNAPAGWTEGGYEPVADILFNEIDVDGYFMEYDSPRAGGFEPLRLLPKGKMVVLGLVSTKTTQMESKDALKRRIDEAARHVPLDQLAISTQWLFQRHEKCRRARDDGDGRDRQAAAGGGDRAGGMELRRLFPALALSLLASHAAADDFAFGRRLFLEKAECSFCHGWAGDGAGHPQSPGRAANLRQSRLARDQLITVIRCGIPGTAMPHFDEGAYSDQRCYGMTEAELGGRTPSLPPGEVLQKREIEALADYLLARIVGRGPITREECAEALGANARSCGEYPAKP